MKNSKFEKSWILYMYTVDPQCKIFNYGLQRELMGVKWLHSGRNKWNKSKVVHLVSFIPTRMQSFGTHEFLL